MKTAINKTEIINALMLQNARWANKIDSSDSEKIASIKTSIRNGGKEIQDDIMGAIRTINELTPDHIEDMGKIAPLDAALEKIASATNVKKALRAIDVLALLVTDNLKYCRNSAKVFCIEYAGVLTCAPKTRDGLRFISTGLGDENTSDLVKVTQARKLHNLLGKTGAGSIGTQSSVTWSNGGIAEILSAIVPGSGARGKMGKIIDTCALIPALDHWLSKLSDSKISMIAKQKGEKK